MPPANSLNITEEGVVVFDGVSIFTGVNSIVPGQALISNDAVTPPTFQDVCVVIKSPTINAKVAAATTIFTPSQPFIITGIVAYGSSIVGGSPGTIMANFGWNNPTYDNMIAATANFAFATGNYNSYPIADGGVTDIPVIPAATPFKINITTADTTATTNNQIIFVLGYYLN